MSAPRAILYDRVSTVLQSTNYSGGKDGFQLDKCRAFAHAHDWPIVGEITDVDSGAEWEIDGVLEAVEKAKRREYEKLIVFETSRFARDVGKKAVYEADLKRHGVQVVYLNLPEGDGPESELMSDMMGALDAYERKRIRKRVMHGIQQKAKAGKVVGAGVAPYGYQFVYARSDSKGKDVPVGLEPHAERAAIFQRIVSAAATTSLADLARILTSEGIPTPTGKSARWTPATLSHLLGSRVALGEWRYGETTVAVPAIIDQATWEEARLRLAERKVARRGRMPEADDEYLLRGMLHCGHCGGLISTWKASRWSDDPDGPREKTTSYLCLRHKPGRATRAGVDTCPLPMLPATIPGDRDDPTRRMGIEDAARQRVEHLILDENELSVWLERVNELYGEAQRTRERQVADLDAKIEQHQRRLERAVEEQLDVARSSPKYALLVGAEQRETSMLADLAASRSALVSRPEPGVSAASLERLQAAIEAYVGELDDPTPERLRALYREIRLRGTVTLDPSGPLRIGYHRYTVAWTALIRGGTGDSDKSTSENWTLFSTDGLTLTSVLSGIAAA